MLGHCNIEITCRVSAESGWDGILHQHNLLYHSKLPLLCLAKCRADAARAPSPVPVPLHF